MDFLFHTIILVGNKKNKANLKKKDSEQQIVLKQERDELY